MPDSPRPAPPTPAAPTAAAPMPAGYVMWVAVLAPRWADRGPVGTDEWRRQVVANAAAVGEDLTPARVEPIIAWDLAEGTPVPFTPSGRLTDEIPWFVDPERGAAVTKARNRASELRDQARALCREHGITPSRTI